MLLSNYTFKKVIKVLTNIEVSLLRRIKILEPDSIQGALRDKTQETIKIRCKSCANKSFFLYLLFGQTKDPSRDSDGDPSREH